MFLTAENLALILKETAFLGILSIGFTLRPGDVVLTGTPVENRILDLWSPASQLPVRLEFFGDEVESCRPFDPGTQRSLEEAVEVLTCPAREALFSEARTVWVA